MNFLRSTGLLLLLASSAQAQSGTCFQTTEELRTAVDDYLKDSSATSQVAQTYGHPIGSWCVRYIQDFSDLFANMRNKDVETFNEPLDGWVTVNARDMSFMFAGAKNFNQDLNHFQTGRVKTMQGMFEDAYAFNGAIDEWDVFNVKDFSYMFHGAQSFAGDLSKWNTLCAENLSYMFYTAVFFNSDVSGWNVASVTDFRFMFDDAETFRQDLCPWDAKISRQTLADSQFSMAAFLAGTDCPVQDTPGPEADESFTALCFRCDVTERN